MFTGRVACLVTSRGHLFANGSLASAAQRFVWGQPGFDSRHTARLWQPLIQQQVRFLMAATADDVRASVRKLLPTLDLDKATERQIREEVAKELGTSMDPYKKVIKEEIDRWMAQETAAQDSGGDDDNDDVDDGALEMPSSMDLVGNRKRGAGAAATGEKPAKMARGTGDSPQGVQLDTQGLKWLSISTFKGQQRVDIRNFFRDKSGAVAPTKKGISLSQAEWSALQGVVQATNQALADNDEAFAAELPNSIRVTTSVFSGKLQVGIRQYYQQDGELKPGIKGINLLPDQWEVLCQAAPDINKQLKATAAPPAQQPAAAAAAAGGGSSRAAGASRAGPAARAGGAAAAAGGGSDGGDVQLGGKKRAAISMFTGSACVDLRECYEKDGQLMPGKKGIMLKPDQWRTLVGAADDITSALNAHNTRYALELGNKRRVAISEFKSVWYVGVREYYEQNGELKPGSKGLSMNREQWQKLVAGMEGLTSQLG